MKKYAHHHARNTDWSSSRDRTKAMKGQDVSHLAGTIEYPDRVTIDFVVFYIHVDGAFHTTLFRLGRLPALDAAPQTAASRGVKKLYQIVFKPFT